MIGKKEELHIVVLEDDKTRIKHFKKRFNKKFKKYKVDLQVFDNAKDCKIYLNETIKRVNLLFLDHDLGGEVFVDSSKENTGSEVVRFLTARQNMMPRTIGYVMLHTLNNVEAPKMYSNLKSAGFNVFLTPGVWIEEQFNNFITLDTK